MILICSTRNPEPSTIDVMDWLFSMNANFIRINGEDFEKDADISISYKSNNPISLIYKGKKVSLDKVNVCWYRRWRQLKFPYILNEMDNHTLKEQFKKYLNMEIDSLSSFFWLELSKKKWLTTPDKSRLNKLVVLKYAQIHNLKIPETIITSSRSELINFMNKHKEVITKAIAEGEAFFLDNLNYTFYTKELLLNHVNIPESFIPILVQKKVEKEFEIRTFYLVGKCYSMAMFTQSDPQTSVDFRHYNIEKPNRWVPFKLPLQEEKKIDKLMKNLGLNNGSLDIIMDKKGDYVFLEINPVGQYGMVSIGCNYHLDYLIADFLTKNDN